MQWNIQGPAVLPSGEQSTVFTTLDGATASKSDVTLNVIEAPTVVETFVRLPVGKTPVVEMELRSTPLLPVKEKVGTSDFSVRVGKSVVRKVAEEVARELDPGCVP